MGKNIYTVVCNIVFFLVPFSSLFILHMLFEHHRVFKISVFYHFFKRPNAFPVEI